MGTAEGASDRSWFVGRADVREAVRSSLEEPGRCRRLGPLGTWGIGKSELVRRLEEEAAGIAEVLRVNAAAYVPFDDATGGEQQHALDYVRNWVSFVRAITDLVEYPERAEAWDALLKDIKSAATKVAEVRAPDVGEFDPDIDIDIDVDGDMKVEDEGSVGNVTMTLADPAPTRAATIDEQYEFLRQKFVETVDSAAEAAGALILVDAFDRLRGYQVGDWLLRLVTGPERAVVVITSRLRLDDIATATRPLETNELPPFTEDEVREFLERRLGVAIADDSLVRRVLDFSEGLPQAVAMAADLIDQRRRTGGELGLADVRVDSSRATTDLLSTIVAEVPEPDVKLLLKEGRFARRLDVDLVHYLFTRERYSEDSDAKARADAAFAKLKAYSFVEPYPTGEEDGLGRHAFHEYITRAQPKPGDETLLVDEERVHATLATYYERRLDDYDAEESDESSYMQLYKLESPKWQALAREWFHHASGLERDDAREAARLAFVRVFLQTFWWWGCYVRYDFCNELVTDWERTQPERDRKWTSSLHQTLDSYPEGYAKLDKGRWADVDSALRRLCKTVGVDKKVPLDDDGVDDPRELKRRSNLRWVRALTSLFRAHSYRFRKGMGKLALPLFEDALRYLEAEDETAARAWTVFELAELHLELGDVDKAAATLTEAAKLVAAAAEEDDEPEDLELLANVQRLHADIAAKRGDDESAIDATARAVLRAFAFLDCPNPPDEYTVAFYDEMRERAADRLKEMLKDKDAATAVQAAERLLARLDVLRRPFGFTDGASVAFANGEPSRESLMALLPPPPEKLREQAREDDVFVVTAALVLQDVRDDPSDAALRGET
jgi:hypothetical protein